MDLVPTAWAAAGQPTGPHHDPDTTASCSRCGHTSTNTSPVTKCVSKKFTALDDWVNPTGRRLCAACAWAFQTPELRSQPHRLSQNGDLAALTASEICDDLLDGPLPSTTALIVPIRRGRKHLVQYAQWGHIATDHGALTWSLSDAARLEALCRLRKDGFTASMLTHTAPPYTVMRDHNPNHWPAIGSDWDTITPWHSTPWMDLAIHITWDKGATS